MINYSDEEPHTATVKQHITQLVEDLRSFCAHNYEIRDYLDASYYIKEVGEMLEALQEQRTMSETVTIVWRDWAGFTVINEED